MDGHIDTTPQPCMHAGVDNRCRSRTWSDGNLYSSMMSLSFAENVDLENAENLLSLSGLPIVVCLCMVRSFHVSFSAERR
jgi:hypothetical protein